MKTYKAVYNKEETEGVFGISLVENPAMEGNFIALSKEQVQFKEVNAEKRILIGLVLEPNKPIYRNQNGNEFNIVFDSDTIRELSYNFFKANHHKNSTIEHENPIQGVTFVESWIVEDPKNDKSNAFGFSYPKGTWMATMKVDSDEVWNDFVKEGKVLGFSIDAIIKLEEVKMDEMTNETFLTKLKDVLGISKPKEVEAPKVEEVKLGMVKTANGETTLQYEGEVLEVGSAVWAEAEDGQRVPLPAESYELEDGNTITVDAESIVSEVKPSAAVEEEAPVEEMAEAPAEAAPTPEMANDLDNIMNAIKKITVQYNSNEDVIGDLKKEVDLLKTELSELKQEPAKPVKKSQPEQVATKKGLTEFLNNKL